MTEPSPQGTLLTAARSGDSSAFSEITEPYRYELRVHCYRILGSLQDAEDMVQETFLRAWRRLETYQERASIRAWLYKIATNACLDALDKQRRRISPKSHETSTPAIADAIGLEPCPDDWFTEAIVSPEARYTAHESMSLAFLAALQLLNPRQRAILILRDVLDWQASEVAELLDTTVSSVNNVLRRARATLHKPLQDYENDRLSMTSPDETLSATLDHYMRAWETADIAAFIAMLKEDALMAMPPAGAWFRGREAIREFVTNAILPSILQRSWIFRRIQANGQPAFAVYEPDMLGETYQAHSIHVLSFKGTEVAELIVFYYPALFHSFGLPDHLAMR